MDLQLWKGVSTHHGHESNGNLNAFNDFLELYVFVFLMIVQHTPLIISKTKKFQFIFDFL